jgi:DNA-binding transcriptional MerR regulator
MSRLGQGLKYLLIVSLTTVGLGIAGGYFYLQYSLRSSLEAGISARLGTPTRLGLARLGLFPPGIRMGGIVIRNPPGFQARDFLSTNDLSLQIDRYDHKARLAHSPQMTIDGLEVWIENRAGRSNTTVIRANQRRYDRQHSRQRADKVKFIIQELRIRDIQAHLSAGSSDREQPIPELVLHDVGARSGGVTLGELVGIVADAALRAAIKGEVKQEFEEYKQEKKRELGRKLEEMLRR